MTIREFLNRNGIHATPKPLASDWAQRHYERVEDDNGQKHVVMICKNQTTCDQMKEYIHVSNLIGGAGLSAPKIHAVDHNLGCMIIEDFGDQSFEHVLDNDPEQATSMYKLAVNTIDEMQAKISCEGLPSFNETAVGQGYKRCLDWYVPHVLNRAITEVERKEFEGIWANIEAARPNEDAVFTHIDFLPNNLMYLPSRDGVKACGLIDIQGACVGGAAYDYSNLLNDIRRDVDPLIKEDALRDKPNDFMHNYDFYTLHYMHRLTGQVIQLALEMDRPDLLQYMPRMEATLRNLLKMPKFSALKEFYETLGVPFALGENALNLSLIGEETRAQDIYTLARQA